MKTVVAKQKKGNEREWFLIDAQSVTLWELATKIAILLKGKHTPEYTPHLDNGANVIVVNCDKFHVTGNKIEDKMYRYHTGFLWGKKEANLKELLVKKPTKPLEEAVYGMLPKTKHRKNMMARLKLFTGAEHNLASVNPKTVTL